MSEKLKELHEVLANELLKRVSDPEAKSADLNVARQFLKSQLEKALNDIEHLKDKVRANGYSN